MASLRDPDADTRLICEQREQLFRLLERIEGAEQKILTDLRCRIDPVAVYDILKKRTWRSARRKQRVQRAMFALLKVAEVKRHLSLTRPNAVAAAEAALLVGALLDDTLLLGGALALDRALRSRMQRASQEAADKRRQKTATKDEAICQHAMLYRESRPYSRQHSTRAMAAWIAQALKRDGLKCAGGASTIRARLRALKLR